jgi:hypothetical protein
MKAGEMELEDEEVAMAPLAWTTVLLMVFRIVLQVVLQFKEIKSAGTAGNLSMCNNTAENVLHKVLRQ